MRRISTQGDVPTSSTLALYKPTRNGLKRSAKGGAMSLLVNTVEMITPTSSRVLRIVSSIAITGVGNNLANEAGTDFLLKPPRQLDNIRPWSARQQLHVPRMLSLSLLLSTTSRSVHTRHNLQHDSHGLNKTLRLPGVIRQKRLSKNISSKRNSSSDALAQTLSRAAR